MRYAQHFAIILMHANNHLFVLYLLHLTRDHKVNDYWDDITTIFMTTLHKAIWTLIGNGFLQISIIHNHDCYFCCFLSNYQHYEPVSFPIFHCIHISCSVTKVAHFGIIALQLVIFILIYNSKNYDFLLVLPSTLLPSCLPITNLM